MINTPHISCNKEDISNIVLMPGDPKRATFIAENYLKDYRLVNDIRGILAYTGYYENKKITIFASGMGMPSIGIYCYELYKYFDVTHIIRIGSCGSNDPSVKVLDVVLSTSAYNEGNFAYTFNNEDIHEVESSSKLNELIKNTAAKNNIVLKVGRTICSEVFDLYITDLNKFLNRTPSSLASEMEAFALFYIAKALNKEAACLLTVADSKFEDRVISSSDRQNSLTNMIELALNSAKEI